MLSSLFPFIYAVVVILLLWQAFLVMSRGFSADKVQSFSNKRRKNYEKSDRTGRLTVHPELLDQEGKITNEELLTVRFSEDVDPDPPKSAETSAE